MKSKSYKYRIVRNFNNGEFTYKIEFIGVGLSNFIKSLFIGWVSIHPTFKTKEEAIKEIETYIIDDNLDDNQY